MGAIAAWTELEMKPCRAATPPDPDAAVVVFGITVADRGDEKVAAAVDGTAISSASLNRERSSTILVYVNLPLVHLPDCSED